jgi:DNA-binding XRE family transcriptional regulator
MMARRYKIQSIRIHQAYDVPDVADLLGLTQQTVRAWIRDGLPVLATQRPVLVLGYELRKYLKDRDANAKRPTALGEFYCMRCRKPRKPFGMLVDYIPINESKGRLVALCSVCETTCNRFATKASLPELSGVFEIAIAAMKHD